jgi:septum formation protein
MNARRIILASRSPRRRALLEEAGWEVAVRVGPVDDGVLSPERTGPAEWTTALAWLKARSARDCAHGEGGDMADWPIVAGDTVCEQESQLIGQPRDADAARAMIQSFQAASHQVWTGLCLLVPGQPRRIGADSARVWLGALSDAELDAYIDGGQWQGKAGGYNLSERVDAGWPIRYEGHASTIMGLPLPLLERLLQGECV